MSWVLLKILVPVVVIGILIFIHELGHFLLAKWCGVGVVKFSVGFGPALVRWRGKETVYQLSLIPLGGFVRMVGDIPDGLTGAQATDQAVRAEAKEIEDDQLDVPEGLLRDRSRWFVEKSLGQRAAIVAAGPIFNLISAVVFVIIAGLAYGEVRPVADARIGGILSGGPAEAAGLKPGDLVLRVDNTAVSSWADFAERIYQGPDSALPLEIQRAGERVTVTVTPRVGSTDSLTEGKTKRYLIGVEPSTEVVPVSVRDAVGHGFFWTYHMSAQTLKGIGSMLIGDISPKELAGPIFIFDATSKQAERGLEYLLYLMALLSVSLAVLNLLPIPVLDGGHLFFFFLEAILGPISIRKKEMAQQVGFVLLLFLMGYAITNDLRRDTAPPVDRAIEWADAPADEPNATAANPQSDGTSQLPSDQISSDQVLNESESSSTGDGR